MVWANLESAESAFCEHVKMTALQVLWNELASVPDFFIFHRGSGGHETTLLCLLPYREDRPSGQRLGSSLSCSLPCMAGIGTAGFHVLLLYAKLPWE